jgi:ABC-type multidrug transport system fused ATPase/permease subunit
MIFALVNLLRLLSNKKKILFFLFILSFSIFSILDIFGLYFLSYGISGIIDKDSVYKLFNILSNNNIKVFDKWLLIDFYLFILLFFFIKNILLYCFYYLQAYFISNVSSDISSSLFKKFFQIDYLKFIKINVAESSKNLTNDISRSIQLINIINIIFKEVILLLLIISIIFLLNINFFISALFLVILLLLIFKLFYSNKLNNLGIKNQYYVSKQIKRILDSFNLFIEIKLYKLVDFFYSKYKEESYKKELTEQKLNLIINVPRLVIEVFVVILLYLFTLFFAVDKILNSIPELSLLLLLSLRTIPSIISLNRAFFDLRFCRPSLNILLKKIKEINNNSKKNQKYLEKKSIFNFKDKIIFKNVSFGYKKNNSVINNINLTIKKNEKIGIYGKSGDGKTTLLLLLLGFIKPTKGKILIDGFNLNKISHEWRKNISFAPQDTFLINDSLIENIAFTNIITKSDIKHFQLSLNLSECNKFLNKKYKNIIIEEKGLNFSGGQRKRLGLARAIYKKADLYIFDEPTSFLDDRTSINILKNLKLFLLNKSAIFVTHNKKLLEFCTKSYNLKSGKLYLK